MSSTIMVKDIEGADRLPSDGSGSLSTTAVMTQVKDPDTAADPVKEKTQPTVVLMQLIRRFGSVSDALRLFGALAVASAMGLYLLDGVQVVNDIQRYLTILGLTAALTTAGLIMSLWLREQRSSRVFIGLALLSVPVNFTVFGALVYSIVPFDSIGSYYPQFAFWEVESVSRLLMAATAGLVVLIPVTWFALSVLARSSRHWLTAALLLSGAVLLVPVRHELLSAALAIGSTITMWWLCKTRVANSLTFKTAEGRFAVALLFIAPIIVVARSMFLYEMSGVLGLALSGGFYVAARFLMQRQVQQSFVSALLVFVAVVAIGIAGVSFFSVVQYYGSESVGFISANAMVLALLTDVLRISKQSSAARKLSAVMLTMVTSGLVAYGIFTASSLVATVSIVMLLAVAGYGYLNRFAAASVIAIAGAIALMLLNAEVLWASVAQTGWWGVALGGAAAIVAGSLLDRAGTSIEVNPLSANEDKKPVSTPVAT